MDIVIYIEKINMLERVLHNNNNNNNNPWRYSSDEPWHEPDEPTTK
jgi:hypothetical protein